MSSAPLLYIMFLACTVSAMSVDVTGAKRKVLHALPFTNENLSQETPAVSCAIKTTHMYTLTYPSTLYHITTTYMTLIFIFRVMFVLISVFLAVYCIVPITFWQARCRVPWRNYYLVLVTFSILINSTYAFHLSPSAWEISFFWILTEYINPSPGISSSPYRKKIFIMLDVMYAKLE